MKKILFFAALVLGMASCQTEPEGLNVMVGGEQEVMLNVSLPESTRSASSAGFDFSNFESNDQYDLRFILEIAYNNTVVRTVKTSETTSATFPVRLAPGRNYTFTVWADLVNEGSQADLYYNILTNAQDGVSALSNITFKEWTPNVEARDAYTYTDTFKFGEDPEKLKMKLTRPFAKVRVVATDIADVRKFDIEPKSATVAYTTALHTAFNAVDGKVAGSATTISPIAYDIVANAYTENTNELTVFADYIFVPNDGTVQFNLDVYADEAHGGLIKENNFSTAIPVEKNKVTSIVGDVLTKGGDVSITIDGALGEKETINYVDNAVSLQEIINNSEEGKSVNITLGGDIDLNDLLNAGTLATRAQATAGLVIPANKTIVLDLKGYTISQSVDCSASYSMITNNGNLTITGEGTIEFTNTAEGGSSTWGTYTIENRGEGVLTIDNATIRHNGCVNGEIDHDTNIAIQNYQGKVVINDGNIVSTEFRSLRDFTAGGEIIINGGTFLGQVWMQGLGSGSSSLTINGGNFTPVVGYDGSSVYITNSSNIVNVAVNGGVFNTKIGCYDATKEGAKGCIVGGEFTPAAKEGTNAALINDDYAWVKANGGNYTLERKADVAKIGDVGYTSLAKAVAAVNDGETITLVADEVFTENNYYDNGGWKDGLGYSGDKSFTIDLNGYTISQNGALNDYLIWIKNDGSKANTITLKNGTLDAGTTAYCAFATASSNKQKMTINLENINLVGNNSNGAVAKIRGGAELNVKSGTVITGKNNYVGIEAVGNNTVVNIYDNAKIYQNGTGSYVGGIVGASYNATMNIYGGYGKSAKCGIIVMSTGATINVSGGEWIANNDGTVATDNNAVLVSQNNRYETGWACKSILNVTGGTFKGGYNCYGMGPGVEPDDAQINIKGGNFNANPASYVAEDFVATEDNGVWTVKMTEEAKLRKVLAEGGEVTLEEDITIAAQLEVTTTKAIVVNGNNKTINYTGSGRAFNVNGLDTANVTLNNLTFVNTASYCQRGINFNVAGKLTLNNVTVGKTGTPATYAINLPGSSDGAEVVINNSYFHGNIALNVWGENATINATDSEFVSHDGTEAENYAAIMLNNDGSTIANGTTIYIDGGSVIARDEKGEPSDAVSNSTMTGVVTISDSTEVVGTVANPVAAVIYEGYNEFYSCTTLKAAIDKAIETKGSVRLIKDIEVEETITIPAEGNVTIDLNGHNITSKIAGKPSEHFQLFSVNGELEIKGNGTISLTSEDFEWNTSYRYTAINIRETGVVTLGNGVRVICEASKDGSYGMSYAVDIYTTGTLNINGASLHSNYIAVRCFYGNSVVNVNSGSKITSSKNNYGIWLQSSPGAVVTIADDVNYTFENNIYYFN